MARLRMPLLLLVLVAVAGALYVLLSAPDYGDINADGLKLGKTAYQQGDVDAAVTWFRLAAKQGDKQAQYLFAMLYRDGEGVSRDDVQAVLWLKLAAAQNQPEAQYQLANMLEYGRGVDVADLKAAISWYKKAAVAGHHAAELRMAMLLSAGRGLAKNDGQALAWAIKAASSNNVSAKSFLQRLLNRITAKAAAGDAAAQFVLARMYQQSDGLNADREKAELWLRQSADSGNAKAQYHLAELLMQRKSKLTNQIGQIVQTDQINLTDKTRIIQQAAAWYLKAAEQGDIASAAKLGALYALGQGVEKDRAQAVIWLKKAAESNNPAAQRNLALLYAEAGDDTSAFNWFDKAARQGDAVAQNNLALMYVFAHGVKTNLVKALRWLKVAAEHDTKAQYNLALMYLRGIGMIQDEDAALSWLKKAQAGNHPVANRAVPKQIISEQSAPIQAKALLAILYDLGEGVVPSETEAESWYQQARRLGSRDARYNLATLYYRHLKFKQAFALFMQAAKQADAEAQNIIASMYQRGQGSKIDLKQSAHWYKQAAELGYAPAQFNLANLYRKGEAMQQQDELAVNWYRKAAKQGFAPAQNALAYMYALGRGVVLDRLQARSWFAQASKQGLTIAAQNLLLLQQNKNTFTLSTYAVDVQLRAAALHEKPLDLARHLLSYHTPRLD
ncbi:MAG: SEL1-like repeat protein [Mariprofundus sp.]|nr:SEL1-like repeat protein [Mariprofundus sp.]